MFWVNAFVKAWIAIGYLSLIFGFGSVGHFMFASGHNHHVSPMVDLFFWVSLNGLEEYSNICKDAKRGFKIIGSNVDFEN